MPALPRRWAPARSGAALLGAVGLLYALILIPATASAAPSAPPPAGAVPGSPVTTVAPPAEGVAPETTPIHVTAPDVEIEPGYWQAGPGAGASVVIAVSNTGATPVDIRGAYTLPAGTRRTTVTAADGCTTTPSQGLRCVLAPTATGTVTLKLAVEADGWRKAPLTGSVTISAGSATDTDSYSLLLTPGPPTPGVGAAVDDITLPLRPAGEPENALLATHLSNTGPTPAAGAVEVVTPAGVDLVTFPPACVTHRAVSANRDRCEVGVIEAGRELALVFGLQVTAAARVEAPLAGAAYGFLAPTGRDALAVLAMYRLVISTTAPSPEPSDTAAGAAATTAAAPDRSVAVRSVGVFSRPLDTIAIVGSVVGLVALAGIIGVLSLRRRLQDDTPSDGFVGRSAELGQRRVAEGDVGFKV
jgi:hypothetical protein